MKKNAQALQPDGFDREEVDGDHALRLRAQERAPGEAGALARWAQACLAEQLAGGCGRDSDAEAVEFARYALVSPPRILAGEAQHELLDLTSDCWSACVTLIGPALCYQSPMPAQQRRWRDKERPPACSREKAAGCGKEDSIGGFQLWPRNLATQDVELVLEHDDLQLLELARAEAKRGQLQAVTKNEVDE
jgi:hypothetical protein